MPRNMEWIDTFGAHDGRRVMGQHLDAAIAVGANRSCTNAAIVERVHGKGVKPVDLRSPTIADDANAVHEQQRQGLSQFSHKKCRRRRAEASASMPVEFTNNRLRRMPKPYDLYSTPDGLPVPRNDGACDHLTGLQLPSMVLPSTNGTLVNLSELSGTTVLYAYTADGTRRRTRLGGLGRDPRRAWLHAAIVRVSRSSRRAEIARRARLRREHADHRLPTRGRRAPPSAVPAPQRQRTHAASSARLGCRHSSSSRGDRNRRRISGDSRSSFVTGAFARCSIPSFRRAETRRTSSSG